MSDTVAFSPNSQTSWAAYVHERDTATKNPERRASDSHEITVDKNELKSEISALLSSIGVAIAHLQHKRRRKSGHISEYEIVQSEAQKILSVLSEPGANHQLGELMRQQSAIRGTFTLEEGKSGGKSGDNDDDDDDAPSAKASLPVASNDNDDNTVLVLARRRGRLHHAAHHHVAIKQDAATIADDSKTDMLAAVAVAGLIRGGDREKLQSFLITTKASMEEAERLSGASGSGATVDQRLMLIAYEGKNISDSMGKDGALTQACVVSAAEDIANLHLGKHKEDCARQFAEARACLVENNDLALLAEFDKHAMGWQGKISQTEAKLNNGMNEARASLCGGVSKAPVNSQEDLLRLVSETPLNGVFSGLNESLAQSNADLTGQSRVLDKPLKKLLVAEADLLGMKAGEYRGDAAAIAQVAGTSRKKIYEEVAAWHMLHHIAPEAPENLNDRIGRINGKWQSFVEQQRQGPSVDIDISL